MKRNSKTTSFQNVVPPISSEGAESSQATMGPLPTDLLTEGRAEQYTFFTSTDVNLTIQLKVSEFTRRQACLIAGQRLFEVTQKGMNIWDWMVFEFLYSYLFGSKSDILEIKDYREFELTLLLKVVLLSGTWFGLGERSILPEDLQTLIRSSRWVPSERSYHSRKASYRIDKFLSVRIVPIDNFIERRKDTVRYSSYCKGYGESGHMGRKKTRPSAELDGEPTTSERKYVNIPLSSYGMVQDLLLAEIRYTVHKK